MAEKMIVFGPSQDHTQIHFIDYLIRSGIPFQEIPVERIFESGEVMLLEQEAAFKWDDEEIVLPYKGSIIFSRFSDHPVSTPKHGILNQLLAAFLNRCDGIVINPRFAGTLNLSKVAQSMQMARWGANTPHSILTNHSNSVQELFSRDVIYKSPSSYRSQVKKLEPRLQERLGFLENSPVLFQQQIIGDNVRVHVVGTKTFAERISTGHVDYRYAKPAELEYDNIDLPKEIGQLCIELTRQSRLLFSGIDLILDRNQRYWFLEVNAMPGYHDYDERCDQEITKALVELLMSAMEER
jgi:glutathione synthase/RimK-type ligase-like ATP-grasp enzyme